MIKWLQRILRYIIGRCCMAETNDEERVELLQFFMDYYGRYHDHKETMAWVATAFYIAGVIYAAFEARYVAKDCSSWQTFFGVFFGLSGILVLIFVCWQLWNRCRAAKWVKCFRHQLEGTNAATHISLPTGFRKGGAPWLPAVLSCIGIVAAMAVAIVLVCCY